tara:strand:- start:177 stop:476 length:300 start_codon:yes stop_codon:yes gene_type:complete
MKDNMEAIEYYKAIDKLNLDFNSEVMFINNIKNNYQIGDIDLTDTILEELKSKGDCFIYKYREQNFNNLPFSQHENLKKKYMKDCFTKCKSIYDLIVNI